MILIWAARGDAMGATRRDGQRARLRPHRRGHVFVCAVSTERGSMWGTAPSRGASSSVTHPSTSRLIKRSRVAFRRDRAALTSALGTLDTQSLIYSLGHDYCTALITGRPTPYPSVRWLGTAMMRPRRVSWRSERSRRLHRTWYARPIPTPDTRDSQMEMTQFQPTTISASI